MKLLYLIPILLVAGSLSLVAAVFFLIGKSFGWASGKLAEIV